MALVYECAEADHLVRLTVTGEMTDETVTELWMKGLSVSTTFSSYKGIVDLSGVSRFSVTPRVIELIAKRESIDLSVRVFVAPSDFIYGSIRMFQILSEKTRKNLHVVRTMQDAYKLLGVESPQFVPLPL